MKKVIKIGFLYPYSSIFPQISQDIVDGINSAIPEIHRRSFQFFPEYINLGESSLVDAAFRKLISFHDVDIISGVISYKLIPDIVQIMQWRKKIGIFFDLGENLPPLESLPINLFFNSYMLWQKEYAMGFWAQQKFNSKGAIVIGSYDAGYQMHSSFWQGAIDAGAEEIDLHVLPYQPDQSSILHLLPAYFDKIEKSKVEFVHAIFCGNEAVEFFTAFKKSTLFGKVSLIVSAPMLTDHILSQINNLNIPCYSATEWNYASEEHFNQNFKRAYETYSSRKANLFALLGYEVGLTLLQALPELENGDIDRAISVIKQTTIKSARGDRNLHLDNCTEIPPIQIEKITIQGFEPQKIVVEQYNAMHFNHNSFSDIHNESISGFKNPYLCI